MKKKIIIIVVSFVLFVSIIAGTIILLYVNNEKSYRSIKVEKVSGDVTIERGNKELTAYQNMNLRGGDKIVSRDDSSMLLCLDEDKYVYIGANSNINLESNKKNKERTVLRVNEGSIVTEVKTKLLETEEFNVETPNSTMAIRGTTFKVDVSKTGENYNISYDLVEGQIVLSVIEKTEKGYNVGVFNVNPMEQFNITVSGEEIIDGKELDNAITKTKNNDESVVINNYKSADDFSTNSGLDVEQKELKSEDIKDTLINLPTNENANLYRLVSLYASFDVYDLNGNLLKENQVKYEAKEAFKAILKPELKEGYKLIGWKINEETRSIKDNLELEIKNTTMVEALFEEINCAGGHTFGDWQDTKTPTCQEQGQRERICSICGFKEIESIEALGHIEGETVVENIVAPTCVLEGSHDEVVYCERCNEELQRTSVIDKALGHNFVDGVCSRCGEEDPSIIEEEGYLITIYEEDFYSGTITSEDTFKTTDEILLEFDYQEDKEFIGWYLLDETGKKFLLSGAEISKFVPEVDTIIYGEYLLFVEDSKDSCQILPFNDPEILYYVEYKIGEIIDLESFEMKLLSYVTREELELAQEFKHKIAMVSVDMNQKMYTTHELDSSSANQYLVTFQIDKCLGWLSIRVVGDNEN